MAFALRTPLVAFGFIADLIRRIPGVRRLERRTWVVVVVLLLGALVALFVWSAQRSPLRVSMADLVLGNVPTMQTWIIVSGELGPEPSSAAATNFHYALTDPALPNAKLIVISEYEMQLGRTTVSGALVGGRIGVPIGDRWVGSLLADAELAREPDPPWLAIGLVVVAALFGLASRTSYPMFFRETPASTPLRAATLGVAVRRESAAGTSEPLPATVTIAPRGPVELRQEGRPVERIRLHSAHTNLDTGELRSVTSSAPALVVRPPTGELVLTFSSRAERDLAYAALLANAGSAEATRGVGQI